MKQEYKDKFPNWCKDDNTDYELILGDDIDSLLTENFLRQVKGYETKFFYNFNMLFIERGHEQKSSIIGCDIDFTRGRCWGNHVTALQEHEINKDSANLNNISKITRDNYIDKFAGSTIIQVLSYYDVDISNLSEEGKMLLLAIDSNHAGFYNDKFHETQKRWLVDVLQYQELYDIILKYDEQDFINIQKKYTINKEGQVWLTQDGYLKTNIDLEGISNVLKADITLPNIQFEKYYDENSKTKMYSAYAKTNFITSREQINSRIVSYSQTYRNSASYTYLA